MKSAFFVFAFLAVELANAAPAKSAEHEIRAQLSPRRYTTLAAEIGAKINRISVREGSSFSAKQVLVSFDCSLQQAQLAKAKASLAAADKTYTANKRLLELNSIGQLEVDIAETETTKARAEINAVNTLLSKCTITAPFAGRVVAQKAQEQQYVQPGQGLLEILDDSVLELEFLVPSRWLVWLKNGYAFQVVIDETGKTYPAKVQRVGARVDPVSQSIKIVAAVDGRFPELISGMSGRISLAPPAGR